MNLYLLNSMNMVIYLVRCMYFHLISERFQAEIACQPACEQVEDHRRQRMYNRRRQSSVEDHAHTASSTHGISSHQTQTTLPSRLSAAVTSAARRHQPRRESADAARETQLASRWPHDSLHTDGPHEDPYDESGDTTNIDILHELNILHRQTYYTNILRNIDMITQTDVLRKQ